MRIPDSWETWFKTIVATFIAGFAGAITTAAGIGVANAAGIKIAQLDLKQLCVTGLAAGGIGVLNYLKKSPLPDMTDTQIQTVTLTTTNEKTQVETSHQP